MTISTISWRSMTRSKGCGVEGRTDVAGDGGGKVELGAAINRAGEDGSGA